MVRLIAMAFVMAVATTPVWAASGIASYYGGRDGLCGRKTANGERLQCGVSTAAHRTLPFGTLLSVNGCRVRINDRGPFIRGRVLDLSPAAAKCAGIHSRGVGRVEYHVIY
jgi:rare lipoprotein A